jgi:hypothetical protein
MSGSRSLISLVPPLAIAGLIGEGGAAYAPSVLSFFKKAQIQWTIACSVETVYLFHRPIIRGGLRCRFPGICSGLPVALERSMAQGSQKTRAKVEFRFSWRS